MPVIPHEADFEREAFDVHLVTERCRQSVLPYERTFSGAMGGSGGCKPRKENAARKRLSNSTLMIPDQAAIDAGFDFRR